MRCHQVLTGAVNRGPCSFAPAGEGSDATLVCASGCRVVILDRHLEKVQSIDTSDVASSSTAIVDCVHASQGPSRLIAASWSKKVYIFKPFEEKGEKKLQWKLTTVLDAQEVVSSVAFTYGGEKLLVGGEKTIALYEADETVTAASWSRVWKTTISSPVYQLQFSPDDLLFASLGKNDRLLKVWFQSPQGSSSRKSVSDSKTVSYDFIYLAHPEPVTSVSWRQKSHLLPGGVLPNVLLTSCTDMIARFWSQTPNLDPLHMHQSIDVDSGFNIKADLKFHITASINPCHDIPLLPDVNRDRVSPFAVHWLNNKTWVYNAVIESSLSQYYASANASRRLSQHSTFELVDYEASQMEDGGDDGIVEEEDEENDEETNEENGMEISQQQKIVAPAGEKKSSRQPATLSRTVTADDVPPLQHAIGNVLNDWRKTADMVFAVYPTDGSLLLWQVDHLDDIMPSLRLVHVSFSSRLPSSFPLEDAYSLTENVVVVAQLEAVDVMQSSMGSPLKRAGSQAELGHHRSNSSLARSSAFPSLRQFSFRGSSASVYPTLSLFTCHFDGAVNLWNMELGDDPLRVTCVVHQRRSSGHRFDIGRIVMHSTLPLAVSVAHVDERVSVDPPDGTNSELILWQTSDVSPLARHDGLHQLAIVNSSLSKAFSSLAWVPASLFNSLPDAQNELNGTLFVANEDANSTLFFHLAVVDAAGLLLKAHKSEESQQPSSSLTTTTTMTATAATTTTTRAVSVPRSPTSLSSLDSIVSDESDGAVAFVLDGTVVSTQSGLHPGCVIKLGMLDRTGSAPLRFSSLLFLHAFSGASFHLPQLRRRRFNESSDVGETFFIVAVTRSVKETTCIHLWFVRVSPPSVSRFSNDGQRRRTVPLPQIESSYLGAQDMTFLPDGVVVTAVTAAVDTKQSFFYDGTTSVSPPPYLFTTAFSDGTFVSWSCQERKTKINGGGSGDDDRSYEWVRWESGDRSLLKSAATVISSPCCNLLACAGKTAKENDVAVSVWQGFSDGGKKWVHVQTLTVSSTSPSSHVALDWVSVEDGSYMLAVATQRRVELFSPANDVARHHSEKWTCVRRVDLGGGGDDDSSSVCLAWTDAGTLIVSRRGEMQLFSQWRRRSESPSPLRRHPVAYKGSLFEEASARTPMLVQYHPNQLLELLNAGKLQRVRAILANLLLQLKLHQSAGKVEQRNQADGRRTLSWSEAEIESSPRRERQLSYLGRVASVAEPPAGEMKGRLEAVPPLSLTDLLGSDGVVLASSAAAADTSPVATETKQGRSRGDDDDVYTSLFESAERDDEAYTTSAFSDDEDDDEDDGTRIDGAFEAPNIRAGEFLPKHSAWLARQLSQFQLPGLSSTDQIRLLALVETVASTQGSFSSQGEKQPTSRSHGAAVALDSASGAGYAAISASSGDTSTIDDCGLRYLLSLRHFLCLLRSLPPSLRGRAFSEGLLTSDFAWAFHSDAEEELLSVVPALQRSDPKWAELRAIGIGWWVRSGDRLRRIVEKVAKARFQAAQQPLDAALFYMALKKKSLLAGLFKTVGDSRMREFFANDFQEERWRRAALKNAYALLGKQRFEHAAAFFILGGNLEDAIDVCVSQLKDIQLALVLTRLYTGEGESGPTVRKILTKYVLDGSEGSSRANDASSSSCDAFLRSLALWMLGEYRAALDTLLVDRVDNGLRASAIFNFHFYLRNHPLLQRHRGAAETTATTASGLLGGESATTPKAVADDRRLAPVNRLSGVGDDPLTRSEIRLLFAAAYSHMNGGCPMLSLDVLMNLPSVATEDDDDDGEEKGEEETIDEQSLAVQRSPSRNDDAGDRSSAFDWSQPLVSDNDPFDWSQPVSSMLLDSSETTPPTLASKEEEEDVDKGNETEQQQQVLQKRTSSPADLAVSQQMKLRSYISLFVDQFRSLPFVASSQAALAADQFSRSPSSCCTVKAAHALRSVLNSALRREIVVLNELCFAGDESDSDDRRSEKRTVAVINHLLYTLVHYCSLHGASGNGLVALRMEATILLQDRVILSQHRLDQTPSHPNKMPPLCLSTYHCLPGSLSPFSLIHSLTKDILSYLVLCREMPTPSSSVRHYLPFIRSLTEQLSVCLLQSVLVARSSRDEPDEEKRSRSSTIRSHLRQQLESVDNDVLQMPPPISKVAAESETTGRARTFHFTESDLGHLGAVPERPTSLPSLWPGVLDWPTAMPYSRSSLSYPYAVLLAEATLAVYLSLIVTAVSTHRTEDVLLLLMNYPSGVMWGRTFGGGAKSTTSAGEDGKSSTTKSRSGTTTTTTTTMRGKMFRRDSGMDVFVPASMTLMDYFLRLPKKDYNQGSLTLDLSFFNAYGIRCDDDDDDDDDDDEEEEMIDDHRNPSCYAWLLMRLAVVRTILQRVKTFIPVSGMEMADLTGSSPLLHSVVRTLEGWDVKCVAALDNFGAPPENLIDLEENRTGRTSLSKHKALFAAQNTPFRSSKRSAQPAKSLWQYLVRQETLHDLFIQYIFRSDKLLSSDDVNETDASQGRLVHQESDAINCFSLIKTNQNYLVLSNGREILEIDAGMVMSPEHVVWLDEMSTTGGISASSYALLSLDSMSPSRPPLIATQADELDGYVMIHSSPKETKRAAAQSGGASSIIIRRPVQGVKRIEAHPSLPHYISGSSDGTAHVWECGHGQPLATHKKLGSRIMRVHFNHFGNKYGVATDGGKLHLFQFAMNMSNSVNAYQTLPCQSRSLNDFTFVSSSSFLASAGTSSDGRNVCLWDTLVPTSSALVKGFSCHEAGACVVAYSSNRQWLISGGRRGEICLFDVRQRCLVQRFTAHADAIECLAIDADEEFFVTGAADGDIKVFRLSPYEEMFHFAGEHSGRLLSSWRGGLGAAGAGVTQLYLTPDKHLLSSGADGAVKIRHIRV